MILSDIDIDILFLNLSSPINATGKLPQTKHLMFYLFKKKLDLVWIDCVISFVVCSKLVSSQVGEGGGGSLFSGELSSVRSLVNTGAGETDAFLTWYPGFINISSEWITLQTIIFQHYIHSPNITLLLPLLSPMIIPWYNNPDSPLIGSQCHIEH